MAPGKGTNSRRDKIARLQLQKEKPWIPDRVGDDRTKAQHGSPGTQRAILRKYQTPPLLLNTSAVFENASHDCGVLA